MFTNTKSFQLLHVQLFCFIFFFRVNFSMDTVKAAYFSLSVHLYQNLGTNSTPEMSSSMIFFAAIRKYNV